MGSEDPNQDLRKWEERFHTYLTFILIISKMRYTLWEKMILMQVAFLLEIRKIYHMKDKSKS